MVLHGVYNFLKNNMTILEISNRLFEYFQENDSFSIEDNFKQIILISENSAQEKALIKLALQKYVDAKMLSVPWACDNKVTWFLEKPLDQFEQNITISGPTINAISNIINEATKQETSNCLNITEKDIQSLLLIINGLVKNNQEQQEGDKFE